MIKSSVRPVHPCEILGEDFIEPLRLIANTFGRELNVTPAGADQVHDYRMALALFSVGS